MAEPQHTQPIRTPATVIPWYRRLSVRLAFGLGLAMFSIQVLTSQILIETYRGTLEDFETESRSPSEPFADYLRTHLARDDQGRWTPTDEARAAIETFLEAGETFVWLDAEGRVLQAGDAALEIAAVGDEWPLCDSPDYCEVELADSDRSAGSAWTQLAINNRPIGTFVLVYFTAPQIASAASRQAQAEVFYRLLASGLVAALTSVLLVMLVTRRLSKLAADASSPLDEKMENVDLPGPFETSGDDEIARLARALNTMRGRIEDLVDSLAERDRQRREWIAQISHDLRTPLTALTVCLDRLCDRFIDDNGQLDRAAVQEAIAVAHQDGQRLKTLVDDLFELARLDANDDLMLEPVPPGELVRQTVQGLRPLADARGITLDAVVATALPTIRADGRRLMRALENMVRNAIHFACGGAELRAECDGGFLRFEVRDDGPGLPMIDGKVVLGPADKQARRPDSAGLGLVVTQRVATAHGGDLGGENNPGGGARVWIRIPIVIALSSDVA